MHPLPLGDHRLLVDAGVLVGAAELDELVDVGAEILRLAGLEVLALDAHDDALGVHRVDDAAPLAEHDRARVRATMASRPVPTMGESVRSSGTAWRCMLEPMSARLASSFSRNGMSAAATDTSCLGLMSM